MPKERRAASSRGRWNRTASSVEEEPRLVAAVLSSEADYQAGLGGTPAGAGLLALPPLISGPFESIPLILQEPRLDLTIDEGIVGMTSGKPEVRTEVKVEPGEATGPERGPKRGFLENVFLNCSHSCPEARNHDDYGLPVPKLDDPLPPGIKYSFDSQDVWRCYAKGFTDWKEYEEMYDTWKKVKQVAKVTQLWDRPPGAMTPPMRLDTLWASKQIGRGREYVALEKCWCMYSKSDAEVNMGLWVCLRLDPDSEEPFPEDPIDLRFVADVIPAAAGARTEESPQNIDDNSIVGGHGIRQKNTGWVNVITFNLLRLARQLDDSFICSWAGFGPEYYAKAEADKEWNKRFQVPFLMQMVSNEYLESQVAVSFQDSKGKLQVGFSTDRLSPPRDDPGVGAREIITPVGGVARMVTSPPAELESLGNTLEGRVLPRGDCTPLAASNGGRARREWATQRPHHRFRSIGCETREDHW